MDAAALICRRARGLGVETTILFLHSDGGPPVLNVDNYPGVTDEFRLNHGIGETAWRMSPMFEALRAQLSIIGSDAFEMGTLIPLVRTLGYTGPRVHPLTLPLLGPGGWFATLVHGNADPMPVDLERQLVLDATELSVWCTERGIGRVPSREALGDFPARRFRIAQLAAEGLTNAGIAQTLEISINTVKSRLKQVFARLHVDNRTELASVLRRLSPMREVPLGVTRFGDVTVSRIRL